MNVAKAPPWLRVANVVVPAAAVTLLLVVVLGAENPEDSHPVHLEGDRVAPLPEAVRRAYYDEMVRASVRWWELTRRFPDSWSQHDDFAAHVRSHVNGLVHAHGLDYTEWYLVYDEGIRKHWAPPGYQPLAATWAPLKPRTKAD